MTAPGTVLVVEDEESIADVLAIALRFHRFEVMTAGTVRDARFVLHDQHGARSRRHAPSIGGPTGNPGRFALWSSLRVMVITCPRTRGATDPVAQDLGDRPTIW